MEYVVKIIADVLAALYQTAGASLLLAALVMTIIPIILLYIALQKYIIQGVVAGAVKS